MDNIKNNMNRSLCKMKKEGKKVEKQTLWKEIELWEEELIRLRRMFHRHPEVGWQEFYTTGKIIEYLTAYHIPFYYGKEIVNKSCMWAWEEEKVQMAKEEAIKYGIQKEVIDRMEGITGLLAVIDTGKEGPTCVLRFDIDGISQEESKDSSHKPVKEQFRSEQSGCMHACGHDGHMAMGLIVTRFLYEHKENFCGKIRIVFQPAEEGVQGGKSFATGGVLEGADYFLSGHLGMGNETGELVLGTYGFLATTKLDVEFIGVSAHAGASPETGKNALLCACHAVLALQTLCQDSRGVSRINVGMIQAGSGRNVIADHAYIQLETRGETTEIEQDLYEKALACVEGSAKMYGCEYRVQIKGSAPEAKSDAGLIKKAKEALLEAGLIKEEKVKQEENDTLLRVYEQKKFKGSEDATYFMKEIQEHNGQALYLGIGASICASHHNTKFDFDERALSLGVKVYIAILEKLMARD